jgi:hypothetical protein
MGRPKIPKEKQRRKVGFSLSPDTILLVGQFQADWIQVHGYRITASEAVERLLLAGLASGLVAKKRHYTVGDSLTWD